MNTSHIEWTTATWNPVTGCTKVSPGCDHCYAETFAERFRGVPGHVYERGFDFQLRPERLEQPLEWSRPSLIFVNSMSDLFHVGVPTDYVMRVAEVMRQASWHTFQVLTKRAERLERLSRGFTWSSNVWLGVSVESPEYYGRIRHLRRVDATVRFLSCEPLLAPLPNLPLEGIGWVIAGGESGPGARQMDPTWVRDVHDQCERADVPFFFKQWGAWAPVAVEDGADPVLRRLGKKAAGRLLDGRTWDEMPSLA
ncbi:MAG: phage Gp37/Gp68 family protein [Candidatus Dormibacteria bacterium]|jgi:protein gp37